MNIYWTEAILILSIKYDHQAFKERLFFHLSIIIVLHCIIHFETTELWS